MKKAVLLFLLLTLFGCAGSRDAELQDFYRRLNEAVGVKTFDAVLIARGEPTSITQGDEIFIATWHEEESRGSAAVPVGRLIFLTPPKSSGYDLRLIFDKQTRLLKEWGYQEW